MKQAIGRLYQSQKIQSNSLNAFIQSIQTAKDDLNSLAGGQTAKPMDLRNSVVESFREGLAKLQSEGTKQNAQNAVPQLSQALNGMQAKSILDAFDKNGDGIINPLHGENLRMAEQVASNLRAFDKDKDGAISPQDLMKSFESMSRNMAAPSIEELLGLQPKPQQPLSLLDNFDLDSLDNLFEEPIEPTQISPEQELKNQTNDDFGFEINGLQAKKILDLYDKNGDGIIEQSQGEDINRAVKSAKAFQSMDTNGDGQIEKQELKNIFNDADRYNLNGKKNGKLNFMERNALEDLTGVNVSKDGLFNKYKIDDFLKDANAHLSDLNLEIK